MKAIAVALLALSLLLAACSREAGQGVHDHDDLRLVSDLQLYLDLYHYPTAGKSHAQAAVAERLPFSVG